MNKGDCYKKGLLEASRPLRKANGCNTKINECYLFHGLGNPAMALNIIQSGMNEHFSGVNAGTMFGDGIYLAEDVSAAAPCTSLSQNPKGLLLHRWARAISTAGRCQRPLVSQRLTRARRP